MRLNELSPGIGAKCPKKRLGRGIGSGLGKTSGKGHKGQKARAGGVVRRGFEGGQTPLYRRLPKFGFHSRTAQLHDEIRLSELSKLSEGTIDLAALKKANFIRHDIQQVKVILFGELTRSVTVRGLKVTKGARAAILAAGGTIEE